MHRSGKCLEARNTLHAVINSKETYRQARAADLCNYAFGTPIATPLGRGHQGVVWSNKGRGETLAVQLHHRLLHSTFATADPRLATLYFIPIYVAQLCMPEAYSRFAACGVDFAAYSNFTRIWEWLMDQNSFRESNGRNHFFVAARPWDHIANVRPQCT